jgi:hypothetical protein
MHSLYMQNPRHLFREGSSDLDVLSTYMCDLFTFRKLRALHMRPVFSTLFLMLNFLSYLASSQPNHFTLNGEQSIRETSWRDSVYLLPAFEDGKVTFIDGFSPDYTLRLNYNSYMEHMYFINTAGDTVPLKKHKTLKLVTIKDKEFYYDYRNGFVEIIQRGRVSLGRKVAFELVERRPIGDEGTHDVRGVIERYDRLYQKYNAYYLVNEKNKIYPAKRSSILRLCKQNKKQVKLYLSAHQQKKPYTKEELLTVLKMCQ